MRMNHRPAQTVPRKAILLDGSHADDHTGERVRAALVAQLQSDGWDVEHVVLREKTIGNCAGDFFCWIRTPGMCVLDDDNRTIAAAIIASDLTVYLTPVTFGGYSSTLKRMVDHQIQNISPFFAHVEGETHHQKRYEQYPDFLAVGWMDAPDDRAEAVFRHLARRNAINWRGETDVSGVVWASQPDEELAAAAREWLADLQNGQSSQTIELPVSGQVYREALPVRRALLLVGSPKTRKSTSHSLGAYLYEQLAAQSIEIDTVYLHPALRSPEKVESLLDALDAADLVTLSFPLYVDSLPAPVIEALERIAAHRQGREGPRRQVFAAIANCGFPEAFQNATALAICETFAQQAGFEWAGGLALSGGGATEGAPLADLGGRTVAMRKALDLAAAALAQGQAVPKTAQEILAKPLIPAWLYRLFGGFGWRQWAKRYGAQKLLRRKPYATKAR
jgi:multimeric flavodoxin WrbA